MRRLSLEMVRVAAAACVTLGLAFTTPGAGAAPAAANANETCLACHGDKDAKGSGGRSIAVAAGAFAKSVHGKAGLECTACHADVAADKIPHDKVKPVDCSTCHEKVVGQFQDGIHAKALGGAARKSAPTCTNCHGTHDIRAKADEASATHRANIPGTCGTCHTKQREQFASGRHGKLRHEGNLGAPGCTDCHGAHRIQPHDLPLFKTEVVKECGNCHADYLATYRDTFHGQVTALGYSRTATCASCHGAHDVRPASDPASPVAPQNRLATCQKCHAGASASFAMWDPHANKHDRARNPAYYYMGLFMEWLLIGVFAFFGLHTVLWLYRSLRVRFARGARPPDAGKES